MKAKSITIASLIFLLSHGATATAESTATLKVLRSNVYVGQSVTMKQARNGMPLHVGDRVVVAEKGLAEIIYPNGCSLKLQENSLLAVKGSSQCRREHTAAAQAHKTAGFRDGAIGQAGSAAATPISCEVTVNSGVDLSIEKIRSQCPDGQSEFKTASLKDVVGGVIVDQGSSKTQASQGLSVFHGDRIQTGLDGKVVVVFDDTAGVAATTSTSTAGLAVLGGVAAVSIVAIATDDDGDASPE